MYIDEIYLTSGHLVGQINAITDIMPAPGSLVLIRRLSYADHLAMIVNGGKTVALPQIVMNISGILNQYHPINDETTLLLTEEAKLWIMKLTGIQFVNSYTI